MTQGQKTVLGLLLVLLALIAVRNKGVKDFLKAALDTFKKSINSTAGGK